MPIKIAEINRVPYHEEAFQIPVNPETQKIADWVGINRGKQVVGFFTTIEQEKIKPEVRTNRGWKYYPVPEGAHYVLFYVTFDDHPKRNDKIIKVAEFRDVDNQKIVASRVETK